MEGAGPGLTSMRERVRLVNGTITIDSKPMGGRESTFVCLCNQNPNEQLDENRGRLIHWEYAAEWTRTIAPCLKRTSRTKIYLLVDCSVAAVCAFQSGQRRARRHGEPISNVENQPRTGSREDYRANKEADQSNAKRMSTTNTSVGQPATSASSAV